MRQEQQLIAVILGTVALLLCLSIVQEQYKVSDMAEDSCCDCVEVTTVGNGGADATRLTVVSGTHGNEPSGTYASLFLMDDILSVEGGRITWIPRVNPCGLQRNERHQPNVSKRLADINRNYEIDEPIGKIASTVAQHVQNSTLVLDFHEGWGWHRLHSDSIGSCLLPSKDDLAKSVADELKKELNEHISIDWKSFPVYTTNHRQARCARIAIIMGFRTF